MSEELGWRPGHKGDWVALGPAQYVFCASESGPVLSL
jgi:hypothetical protein